MLQTELGEFASLANLRCPRRCPRWNVLREGLSSLERLLHGDQVDDADSLVIRNLMSKNAVLLCHDIQLFLGGSVQQKNVAGVDRWTLVHG